jgi:hypothetical protein
LRADDVAANILGATVNAMRATTRRAGCALALAAALAIVPAAQAGGGQEQTHLTASGQAAAAAAVMTLDDLNAPAGWKGGPTKPDLSPAAPCAGFTPKQSDLVRTGAAQSVFGDSTGISFDSEAQVLRSAKMLILDWKRTVLDVGATKCLRSRMVRQITTTKRTFIAFGRLSFPSVTKRTRAFRVIYDDKIGTKTTRRFTDLVFIGTARTELFIGTAASLAQSSFVVPAEIRLAQRLVARTRA